MHACMHRFFLYVQRLYRGHISKDSLVQGQTISQVCALFGEGDTYVLFCISVDPVYRKIKAPSRCHIISPKSYV